MFDPTIYKLLGESVSHRTTNCRQPQGGYLPLKKFNVIHFDDGKSIDSIPSEYANIVGLVVDYMTRYLIMRDNDERKSKLNAFIISRWGAVKTRDHEKIKRYWGYFRNIKGLSVKSIQNAAKIVCFDTSFRQGIYNDGDLKIDIDEKLAKDIIILIKRCIKFFKEYGPIVAAGFDMDGGYSDVIQTGDGDYLTEDTLWDFKVSRRKPTYINTLQVLVYYIMGIHSKHTEFDTIRKIGIFNPFLNDAYYIDITDISDDIMYAVSKDVIGYKLSDDISNWKQIEKPDNLDEQERLKKLFDTKIGYKPTRFNTDNYEDGIHEISLDDYRTFCQKDLSLSRIRNIYFLKKGQYKMFVYKARNFSIGILNGGRLKSTIHSIEYFYKNLDLYGDTVLNYFSKYWDYLKKISDFLQDLEPDRKFILKKIDDLDDDKRQYLKENDEELERYINLLKWSERPEGRMHGCIVDIDYYNHIYVDPFNGQIKPYNAETKYKRSNYKDLRLLLQKEKPQLIESLEKNNNIYRLEDHSFIEQLDNNKVDIANDEEINIDGEISRDMDMYDISSKVYSLQSIYETGLIRYWYDTIIKDKSSEKRDETVIINALPKNDDVQLSKTLTVHTGRSSSANRYIGRSKVMKNGKTATIIEFFSKWDITVRFEDGKEVKDKSLWDFKYGNIE